MAQVNLTINIPDDRLNDVIDTLATYYGIESAKQIVKNNIDQAGTDAQEVKIT